MSKKIALFALIIALFSALFVMPAAAQNATATPTTQPPATYVCTVGDLVTVAANTPAYQADWSPADKPMITPNWDTNKLTVAECKGTRARFASIKINGFTADLWVEAVTLTKFVPPYDALVTTQVNVVYPIGNKDDKAIQALFEALNTGSELAQFGSQVTLLTKPADDQFTIQLGSAGVTTTSLAGLGDFTIPAGKSTVIIGVLPTGAIQRGLNISGSPTGTVMASLSAEPAAANVSVHIRAIMGDGTLVEVANTVTNRVNNVGRFDKVIHYALWQQELTTNVPVGYLVEFDNASGAATNFRVDHNPSRTNVAEVNIDQAWIPSVTPVANNGG